MRYTHELSSDGKKLLACYLPLGDPQMIEDQAEIYISCGVNILEVGLPHADPFMDGEVVKKAMARALSDGVDYEEWRQRLKTLRHRFSSNYIAAMGYVDLLPIVTNGSGGFLVDGILHIGLAPPNQGAAVDSIGFVSTELGRAELEVARQATGYILLQANAGKTGLRNSLSLENCKRVARLRTAGVQAPILLGFGISTPGHAAKAVSMGADGVVIGTACLRAAEGGAASLGNFLTEVREALDA